MFKTLSIFKERCFIFRLRRNVFHVQMQVVHFPVGIRVLMKGQISTCHSRQVSAAS
jgi:hypothetical protein